MRGGQPTLVLWLASGIAATLLAAVMVGGEAHGLAGAGRADGQVHLATDDGGAPMFAVSNLTPGRQLTRCITVFHEGVAVPGELGMTAHATGALGRYLDLTVDSGTGGRFGRCDGFVGRTRYRGTVEEFAVAYRQSSAGLGVPTATASATVFRFTVTVRSDAAAMGTSGTAAFGWRAGNAAVSVPVLPPPSGRRPSPRDDLSPGPVGPSAPAPMPQAPDASDVPHDRRGADASRPEVGASTHPPAGGHPTRVPDPTDTATPRQLDRPTLAPGVPGAGGTRRGATGAHGDGGGLETRGESGVRAGNPGAGGTAATGHTAGQEVEPSGWRDQLSRLLPAAAAVIAAITESASVSLLFLLLVLVFLLIQDRIDRRDPKLADAPVGPEPDLVFQPPPTVEGRLR